MSELPTIDQTKVAQKLLSINSDITYRNVQLEVLAESLRDERDVANRRVEELLGEVARLTPVDENPEEG